MSGKRILTTLNIFFMALFMLALFVFFSSKTEISAEKIIARSAQKQKTFGGRPVEIRLENGIKAWFLEDHDAPLVALNFYFDGAGFAFDDNDKQGLAVLVSDMLLRGGGNFDEESFQNLLETNAIKMTFHASDEIFEGAMTFPKIHLNVAADLLNAVLTKPTIDEKNLETLKTQQIASIEMQNENPESVLGNEFRKRFFENHAKGRLSIGTKEGVSGLSKKDLEAFVQKNFRKDNLVIAIAGDMTENEVKSFLNEVFLNLPDVGVGTALEPSKPRYNMKEENIERKMPQVISIFVAKGAERLDSDFYPLYIVNEIFGGSGLSSRLNIRAREKEGLTYGAYTSLNSEKGAPRLVGSFSASKENYEKMKSILLDEWHKMGREGVQQAEFKRIKNSMLNSFNLRFDSLANISRQLLYMQKEHLGIDFLQKRNEYVSKISFDAVNHAAKKYFADEPSILTIGHNN